MWLHGPPLPRLRLFQLQVQEQLPKPPEAAPPAADGPAASAADGTAATGDTATAMDTDAAAAAPAAAAEANGNVATAAGDLAPELVDKLTKLRDILSGKTPIGLNLEFLYHHNHADLQVGALGDPGFRGYGLGVSSPKTPLSAMHRRLQHEPLV